MLIHAVDGFLYQLTTRTFCADSAKTRHMPRTFFFGEGDDGTVHHFIALRLPFVDGRAHLVRREFDGYPATRLDGIEFRPYARLVLRYLRFAVIDLRYGYHGLVEDIVHNQRYLLFARLGQSDIRITEVECLFCRHLELGHLAVLQFDAEMHLMIVPVIGIEAVLLLRRRQRGKEIMLVQGLFLRELMAFPPPYSRRGAADTVIHRHCRLNNHVCREIDIHLA